MDSKFDYLLTAADKFGHLMPSMDHCPLAMEAVAAGLVDDSPLGVWHKLTSAGMARRAELLALLPPHRCINAPSPTPCTGQCVECADTH